MYMQFASMQCTELQYNITSRQSQISLILLVLTAQDRITPEVNDFETSLNNAKSDRCTNLNPPCTALLTTPVYINVTIEECPLGFILNKTIGICDYDQTISRHRLDPASCACCGSGIQHNMIVSYKLTTVDAYSEGGVILISYLL